VTVGLPVSDLGQALGWYQAVFGLGEPDLAPADGVLEFQVGPVWLQLGVAPVAPVAPLRPLRPLRVLHVLRPPRPGP
jgi:hypothetical protein